MPPWPTSSGTHVLSWLVKGEIQEDATEVAGLNDAILITTGSPMLILAGASGDFVVTGGVELQSAEKWQRSNN